MKKMDVINGFNKNYAVLVSILAIGFAHAQDWQLVWSDEFNGGGISFNSAINPSNWFHQTQLPMGGSWYNGEVQHYTDRTDNSYVSNGTLKIVAKRETYTDQGHTKEYTSARLNSKYAFTYGKVEIKAKLPQGAGTWPAIWMLGKNIYEPGAYWQTQGYGTTSWPACGEVDIMEHWGHNQNYVQSAIHTPSSFGGTINHGGQYISTASSQFHVYTIEWSAEEMEFSVDGNVHYTYDPAIKNSDTWPFDSEQYLLLNIAIEPSIASSFTESSMEIDYVRIYEYQGPCADITCGEGQTCDNGNCVDIPIDPTVTFLVDMQNEEVDGTGVYVSGADSQLAGPSGLLMSDQGNGIWSLTVPISPGTYTYKFRNGFYNDWNGPGWEPDLSAECGYGEWNDRQFTFSNTDLVLGPYYFGSCELSENESNCDNSGDVNDDGNSNVLDIVAAVGHILGNQVLSDDQVCAVDMNLDGTLNVLDIVHLVDIILNSRGESATHVEIIKTSNTVQMRADGFVGAVQMTLNHSEDFELTLTSKALFADYNTIGNSTTVMVVSPEGNELLFTAHGEFTIESVVAASTDSYLNTAVRVPDEFAIGNAYPNPFNPSTTLLVELNTETYVSMSVFNVMGQLIEVIAEGYMNAGIHVITWDASQFPSGIYLVNTVVGNSMQQQKVMLLK